MSKNPPLNATKVKSEEQIGTKSSLDNSRSPKNPKSLKEKSVSSSAIVQSSLVAASIAKNVGPFAAIRENELQRKKKSSLASLNLSNDEEEEEQG
uniref:Uncharacterized protein n=1 Tax=Ditylenchus dipsaci TaxID=166011 RepID=A0A915EAQ9_9BILA